jgi:uncharacterized OB-fold protein
LEKLSTEDFYSEGDKTRKLLGLKCENGHYTLPPMHCCIVCQSFFVQRAELSGKGEVLESTEMFSKSGEFPIDVPYHLALVKLDEGPNLLGILEEPTTTKVKVEFKKLRDGERARIFFVPDS